MLRLFSSYILLLLVLSFRTNAHPIEDSLWHAYTKAKGPLQKADILLRIADEYDLRADVAGRDSVIDLALDDIHIRVQDSLQLYIYNWYFEKGEEYLSSRSEDYAKNIAEIARKYDKPRWSYYASYAKACNSQNEFDSKSALNDANEAFYFASLTNDPKIRVRSMLLLGTCLQSNNKKVEAFKKFTDALYLSRETENYDLVYLCYQKLAYFYFLIDNREKAKEYVKEQYKLLLQKQPMDSLAFVRANISLSTYLLDNNERKSGEKIFYEIVSYSTRHNYKKMRDKIFSIYRTFLMNNGYFKELSDLYSQQFPEELEGISRTNPLLFYRIKAIISETRNDQDSAEFFHKKAEDLYRDESNKAYAGNLYKRYGEFLVRRGRTTEAEEKLKLALEYNREAEYIPMLLEITHILDSLTFSQGKTTEAYEYAKLNQKYARKAELAHQEEELLKLEIDNQARERELLAKQEAETTTRRHNIQYMGISIVIIFSFIVLAILGSFKVHKVVVKALGFFSFIFFFEFIIMLADHEIHHFTHGEPWKFLAFKIILIAMLLPLHHWLEEKVIHYLVSHRMVDASRISVSSFFKNLRNNWFPAAKGHKVAASSVVPVADEMAIATVTGEKEAEETPEENNDETEEKK